MLKFYAQRFDTVEIDATFYRMPEPTTLAAWKRTVPREFVFAAKASRYITHMKKLKDPRATAVPLLDRMRALGRRLGPILFQLPPRWRYDEARLEAFLAGLSSGLRYAFEFRDPSWHNPRCYAQLERRGAAWAIYDLDRRRSPIVVTADFVYIRLHGPDGAYRGHYRHEALEAWADRLTRWSGQGLDTYCYFDNDELGYAANDAYHLRELLDGAAGSER
jgi:uncharacterized protein YecE (DUF72 family)